MKMFNEYLLDDHILTSLVRVELLYCEESEKEAWVQEIKDVLLSHCEDILCSARFEADAGPITDKNDMLAAVEYVSYDFNYDNKKIKALPISAKRFILKYAGCNIDLANIKAYSFDTPRHNGMSSIDLNLPLGIFVDRVTADFLNKLYMVVLEEYIEREWNDNIDSPLDITDLSSLTDKNQICFMDYTS